MNILILGIGGPTPRSIASRLRNLYPDAHLVGVDANPKALGFFIEGLLNEHIAIPRADAGEVYWDTINNIVKTHQIDLAFVQPEYEVLAWGRYLEENGRYPCPTLISLGR
jgi:carbamoyl-phosphate synthase large subunit